MRNFDLPAIKVDLQQLSGASGIAWAHDNARSPERHLPETVGPGCAFFDYDSDGWLDIYLVNSGASDFFSARASLSNALYHNNRDGTFSNVTGKARVSGGGLRRRRLAGSLRHQLQAKSPLSQQRQWDV